MKRKTKAKLRGAAWLGAYLLVFGLGALLIGAVYSYFTEEFPDVTVLRTRYPVVLYRGPDVPTEIRWQKGRPGGWLGLKEIAKPAVDAVLVSEDWAFYQHKGYDMNQIREAIKTDLEKGSFVRGASTITQQVVKNVFLEKDKTIWRKFRELVLSVRIEEKVGKSKILETYLNVAEWGHGIYGIGSAARFYFGKAASDLTAREGAFLAMLLPSPKRYSQSFRKRELTDYARSTVDTILEKMTQAGYLTDEELAHETAATLSFESVPESEPEQRPEED